MVILWLILQLFIPFVAFPRPAKLHRCGRLYLQRRRGTRGSRSRCTGGLGGVLPKADVGHLPVQGGFALGKWWF